MKSGRIRPDEAIGDVGAPGPLARDTGRGSSVWVTSLVSNRRLRLHREQVEVVLEDVNERFVARAEQAFDSGSMSAENLGRIRDTLIQQLTSVAFGGPDRRTV
jgi:hypothetical protein